MRSTLSLAVQSNYVLLSLMVYGSLMLCFGCSWPAGTGSKNMENAYFSSNLAHSLLDNSVSIALPPELADYLNQLFSDFNRTKSDTLTQSKVIVISAPGATALAMDRTTMLISLDLLNLIQTEDQLAFVLAHEAAHIQLNHHLADTTNLPDLELAADERASADLAAKGFNPLHAQRLLLDMHSHYPTSTTHPSLQRRLEELQLKVHPISLQSRVFKNFIELKHWLKSYQRTN